MSDDFEDDLWVLFEAESLEHCTNCEDHLFGDDEETTPGERLNTLFRAFHSLKSLASSMGMQNMVELAHACEDILGAARNGHISITSDIKSGLIEATDLMRQPMLATRLPFNTSQQTADVIYSRPTSMTFWNLVWLSVFSVTLWFSAGCAGMVLLVPCDIA